MALYAERREIKEEEEEEKEYKENIRKKKKEERRREAGRLTRGKRRRVIRVVDDALCVRMIVVRHLRNARSSDLRVDLTDRGRSSSSSTVRGGSGGSSGTRSLSSCRHDDARRGARR